MESLIQAGESSPSAFLRRAIFISYINPEDNAFTVRFGVRLSAADNYQSEKWNL